MVRNDIKNSSLLKTKFLIYAFNGRTTKSLVDIGMSVERISNHMENINKNNPGLQSEISDLFKYGK